MNPIEPYVNYFFDEYMDLPITVLEHFEWAHDDGAADYVKGFHSFSFIRNVIFS